jgi:hypothetical protein
LRANEVRDDVGSYLPAAALGNLQVNISSSPKLDVAAMLAAGQATVSATTWDIGGPEAIFDSSIASLYRTPNIDPAVITLSFTSPQTFTGFRALMSYPSGNPAYYWKVESANSLADLDGHTGSYSVLVPQTGTPAENVSTRMLPSAMTASYVRLTVQKLAGDDYVHINSWELLTNTAADAAAPTAALMLPPLASPGERISSFRVHYLDDSSINIRTVNFGDVRVTGPNGFAQTAALYGLDVNANGPSRDADYFIAAPGGSWDYSDNGLYTLELVGNQVFDLAGKPIAPTVLGAFVVTVPPPESRPRIDLTELNAHDWYAFAASASASTTNDVSLRTLGESSVRFDTTGGFDTYLRYEPANGALWDLTATNQFHFDVYAANPSPFGFQVEPIVRFVDADGDAMEFRYYKNGSPYVLWNDARNTWLSQTIAVKSTALPLTGWRGTAIGTPDWTRIRTVEIHADTWDFGFSLWFDRMGFNLPLIAGDYSNDAAVDGADFLTWQRSLGSKDPSSDGDAGGNVDAADLSIWKAHFPASALASIEPNAVNSVPSEAIDALFAGGDFTVLFATAPNSNRPSWRPWRR